MCPILADVLHSPCRPSHKRIPYKDLQAVNPNRVEDVDTRTPEDLLDLIEEKGKEVQEILATLRSQ